MRTREFDKIKPYSYILIRLKDGKKYFGVRFKNIRLKKTPLEDFGKTYFSSGIFKFEFRKNPSNFKFLLHSTFDTIDEAVQFEYIYNKNFTVKNDSWANLGAFPYTVMNKKIRSKLKKSLNLSWKNLERRKKHKIACKKSWNKKRKKQVSEKLRFTKNLMRNKKRYRSNTKKLWKNQNYRSRVISNIKKAWVSKNKRKQHSKLIKKRYNNIIYLKKFSKAQERKWQNKKLRVKQSKIQQIVWRNLKLRKRQKEIQNEYWNIKNRKNHSSIMKKLCNKKEYIKKKKIINLTTWKKASKKDREKHKLACKKAWQIRKLKIIKK